MFRRFFAALLLMGVAACSDPVALEHEPDGGSHEPDGGSIVAQHEPDGGS